MAVMSKEKFLIKGLSGERELFGEIEVRGSKNAVLPVLAASFLFEDGLELENVPMIEDVFRMSELLEKLGMKVLIKEGNVSINPQNVGKTELDREISKKMRSSVFLAGPLLSRFGKVSFPHPGGCVIGERPINLFLRGFEKMGAEVVEKNGYYFLSSSTGKLTGAEIFFPVQSVGATETFLLAAVLAEGRTILKNVALEPEIESLVEFLNSAGAEISGLGTTTLEIEGGGLLKNGSLKYKAIPDRIETGCFLILGALSAKELTIKNCQPKHIEILIEILKDSGVLIEVGPDFLKVSENKNLKNFKSFNIKTHEYPGFPTDLQAPTTLFLTQAEGQSLVFETLFESRLNYISDLVKMGADITLWDAHRIMISGPTPLKGRELEGPDIRAGLAFVIAAITAHGESVINNVYYIDRGYERIEERLQKIGLKIKRTSL